MKYLDAKPFSINGTGKVMPGTCLRCTFNEGLHSDGCQNRFQLVESNGTRSTVIDWNRWILYLNELEVVKPPYRELTGGEWQVNP